MNDLSKFIRTVPDYPKPGIMFKDITPILANAPVFNAVIEVYANHHKDSGVDIIAGPEARGFIFASALAFGCPIAIPDNIFSYRTYAFLFKVPLIRGI